MSVLTVWRRGFGAALRLAALDPGGAGLLPVDRAGARASFQPLVLILPSALLLQVLNAHRPPPPGLDAVDLARLAAAGTPVELARSCLSMVIELCLYYLLVERILTLRGVGALFPRFVAASNWASLVMQMVLVPVTLLSLATRMSDAAAMAMEATAFLWSLFYQAYTLRYALALGWLTACGLVALDLTLTGAVSTLVHTPLLSPYLK